jgi:hypothetical protein
MGTGTPRGGAFTIQQRDRMLAALLRDVPAPAMVEMIPEISRAVPADILHFVARVVVTRRRTPRTVLEGVERRERTTDDHPVVRQNRVGWTP